jgi:hypothetical protein
MKLTDILRQINEEEEEENGLKSPDKANYEVAIIPSDMQAALDALSNSENYVVKVKDEEGNEKIDTNFSRTFSDRSQIDKIFGRSKMAEKNEDAMNNWNSLSPVGRRSKVRDLQKREPEVYKKGIEGKDFIKAYDFWQSEGNEGSEEDFIVANDYKSGVEFAPIKKISKLGTDNKYFPQKNADTLKKYAGTLSIDTNYDIDGDKIVFPSAKNAWGNKELIKRRIKTIMGNAGVEFKEDTTYQLPDETPTQEPTLSPEPQPAGPSVLTLTLDPDKIKGKKPELNNIVKLLKNTYDKNFDYNKETNVIKIANIKPERRDIVRSQFGNFLKKTDPIKESLDFDLERYQMLRRAGIIK